MTRIELVIDELVLVGFDPLDRHRVSDAIARELTGRMNAADLTPERIDATIRSAVAHAVTSAVRGAHPARTSNR